MTPEPAAGTPGGAFAGRTVVWAGEPGVLQVAGKDAVDLLHRLSTNDLRPLEKAGLVRSTVLTTPQGKMVDWCWVVRREAELLLVTSAGRADRVHEWLDHYTILEDVRSVDVTAAWRFVVAQGTAAGTVAGLADLPAPGSVREQDHALWWSGLPAAAPRLEGLVPTAALDAVIQRAVAAGAEHLDATGAEVMRVLNGAPSPAHEFVDEVIPLELRLARVAVSFDKGCYIGQEVIARLDTYDKLARVLMGFECGVELPRGVELKLTAGGRPLGRVTSVVSLPGGGSAGLAVVKRELASEGPADVEWPQGRAAARLRDRPFWLG